MTKDSQGDRMKRYEEAFRHQLPPRQPLIIRVDGRAFHTYTRDMVKPFDPILMEAMVYATRKTADDMQGFKLAYTQSDEATFLITDFDKLDSQGWFGYELNKVVSLSASLFTAHFNWCMGGDRIATFDSRAFVVPLEDVPNVFTWRQKDWFRNSISMLAQAHFSHKQLHGKKTSDMHDMLHDKGINWATDLTEQQKNGTFVRKVTKHFTDGLAEYDRTEFVPDHSKADYMQIRDWIAGSPVEAGEPS